MAMDTQRQEQLLRTKVPKLRYRNAAPNPLSPIVVHPAQRDSPNAPQRNSPLPQPSPSISSSTLSPTSAQFSPFYSQSVSSASISSDSLSVPSPSYTESVRQTKAKAAKDKMTSLFGFFAIREPSQQAWIDYQATIKKQQTNKRSRSPNVGVPMVSSAKLPSHVPAVNSRWDGVPEGTKERRESSPKGRRESNTPDRDSRSPSLSLQCSRKNSNTIPIRFSSQQSHHGEHREAIMPRFSLQAVNDILHRGGSKSSSTSKPSKPSHTSMRSSTTSPPPSLAPITPEPLATAEAGPLEQPTRPSSRASHASSTSATASPTSSSKPPPRPLSDPPRSPRVAHSDPSSPALPHIRVVQPLNHPSEVTVFSKGPNILSPPFSTRRGIPPKLDFEAIGIRSALSSPAPQPPSILKKSTAGRMGMHHIQLPNGPAHTRDLLIAPWPSPGEGREFFS